MDHLLGAGLRGHARGAVPVVVRVLDEETLLVLVLHLFPRVGQQLAGPVLGQRLDVDGVEPRFVPGLVVVQHVLALGGFVGDKAEIQELHPPRPVGVQQVKILLGAVARLEELGQRERAVVRLCRLGAGRFGVFGAFSESPRGASAPPRREAPPPAAFSAAAPAVGGAAPRPGRPRTGPGRSGPNRGPSAQRPPLDEKLFLSSIVLCGAAWPVRLP